MNWLKRLFLKWSGHKCLECNKLHYTDGWAELDADPEWQQLLAEQFDKNGNLLPYAMTPRYKEMQRLAQERRDAYWEKQRQDDLVRKVAAKFNKPL